MRKGFFLTKVKQEKRRIIQEKYYSCNKHNIENIASEDLNQKISLHKGTNYDYSENTLLGSAIEYKLVQVNLSINDSASMIIMQNMIAWELENVTLILYYRVENQLMEIVIKQILKKTLSQN